MSGASSIRPLSMGLVLVVWTLAFGYAAPHIWWLFGVETAFPGNAEEFETAFQRTWFTIYNLLTTAMVIGGAGLLGGLERHWFRETTRRVVWRLVLVGAILLLIRGALGMYTTLVPIVLGDSEWMMVSLMWECWFVLTGVLYAAVARRNHARAATVG